jgi:class 3 adenylate cyclase
VLVYFGYPMAHEDDARRGVQAALEILRLVRGLDRKLRFDKPISISLRIGLHTGLAVVGDVGGDTRTERLAQGEAPNIAARMQALAEPDTIVISAVTRTSSSRASSTRRVSGRTCSRACPSRWRSSACSA